ncbi:MAG: PaaI family thioesterase [Janthinobacterium lividum]
MSDIERLGRAMMERATASEEQAFGSFFLLRLLGMSVRYDTDTCTVSFEVVPSLFNPQGTLHGGVLATAMDISMGHLLHQTGGAGATLEMKVQYFAPVTAGRVDCVARFLRQGRSISFLQSSALREDGTEVAHATATWKRPGSRTAS